MTQPSPAEMDMFEFRDWLETASVGDLERFGQGRLDFQPGPAQSPHYPLVLLEIERAKERLKGREKSRVRRGLGARF